MTDSSGKSIPKIILGSQSPRRRKLLEGLVAAASLSVIPPLSDDELSFDSLTAVSEIEERLLEIVRQKQRDVQSQINSESSTILCADTVVVVFDFDGKRQVLGKPPQNSWQQTVRHWFKEYYSQKTHEVWTGFEISALHKQHSQIVKTAVTMPEIPPDLIDWYLSTEEPIGKAGGYGIQGHAAMFVSKIEGSLTNVIGLPVVEVAAALRKTGIPIHSNDQTKT